MTEVPAVCGRRFGTRGENGGPANLPNITNRHWRSLLRAAGLPDTHIYSLRHSHVSIALSAGIPVHVVSARVGHSSATMTLNAYAHCLPQQGRDAAQVIAAALAVPQA
jgi:integrase